MFNNLSLEQYLVAQQKKSAHVTEELVQLLLQIGSACQTISDKLRQGELSGIIGQADSSNIQGEKQQKLDVIANDILLHTAQNTASLAGVASEELDEIFPTAHAQQGNYLLLFDPLDGSSNIDINMTVGTIFSILQKPHNHGEISKQDFLQAGNAQIAAGYAIYGPQTQLVFTLGRGVVMFTLDNTQGTFVLTKQNVTIAASTKEFAINMSNYRHWEKPMQQYVDELLQGSSGARAKDYNMRWVAAMVADIHRILTRGGIFIYPWDNKNPARPGKLRLMYEANPMSYLIEQAGGAATDCRSRILEIVPEDIHQRVSVAMGSKAEVQHLVDKHLALTDTEQS